MPPELGRLAFRLGILILVPAIWLVLTAPHGSAGFVVSVFTAIIALLFLIMVAVVARFFSH